MICYHCYRKCDAKNRSIQRVKKKKNKKLAKIHWAKEEYWVCQLKNNMDWRKRYENNAKRWIVSVKWMNVLLQLILLFYSNRLCILSPSLHCVNRFALCLFFLYAILRIITFCVFFFFRFEKLSLNCFEWSKIVIVSNEERYKQIF